MEDTIESDYKQGREVRRLYRCKETVSVIFGIRFV